MKPTVKPNKGKGEEETTNETNNETILRADEAKEK
jgi:hypothetical protein